MTKKGLSELVIPRILVSRAEQGLKAGEYHLIKARYLPRLEEDAIKRHLVVEKEIKVPDIPNGPLASSNSTVIFDLAITLPRIMLRGKVPLGGLKLIIRLSDSLVSVLIYDHDYDKNLRKYPHPHCYERLPYVCSMGMQLYMSGYLKKGKVASMIPYAIRVVSKGQRDGAHSSLAGIPWCGSCSKWIGDYIESPMDMAPDVRMSGMEASPEFLDMHFDWDRRRCSVCHGQRYLCQECDDRNNLKTCKKCGTNLICDMHYQYLSGYCYDCYKNQGLRQ